MKVSDLDYTGFSWRERLAIFLLLKAVVWVAEGTSLHVADISLLKHDIEEGLKNKERDN